MLYLAPRGLDACPADPVQQHYLCFAPRVLPAVLIHYYFDHFLFLRIDGIITPTRGVPTSR